MDYDSDCDSTGDRYKWKNYEVSGYNCALCLRSLRNCCIQCENRGSKKPCFVKFNKKKGAMHMHCIEAAKQMKKK